MPGSFTRQPRRVVITGVGHVSPLGSTKQSLFGALREQRSGVDFAQQLPTDDLPCPFAAEARQFSGSIDDFGELEKATKKAIKKGIKLMCRETQMGVAAAQLALADAKTTGEIDPNRAGVVFGSDYMLTGPDEYARGIAQCGGTQGEFLFQRWGAEGLSEVTPLWLLKYLPNMPASHIAIYNDLRGPNNSLTQREAAGLLAIGEAMRTIRRGHADQMLTGATGTRLHPIKVIHAVGQEQIAKPDGPPGAASRPFDKHRTGMVLGEGAAAIVLEEFELARRRGATIYGEILGAGSALATDRQLRGKSRLALARAMKTALQNAGVGPEAIGHINAHGLGTVEGDRSEALAIHDLLGDRAPQVPVAAAKSYFGNLGAGGGVVELIASLLCWSAGELFPTLNYQTPDPSCGELNVAVDRAVPPGDVVLAVNVTPQGQAAALVVRTA